MSARIPLQAICNNTPDYSSMVYESYCPCCYCENPSMYMDAAYPTADENCYSMSTPMDVKKKSSRRSKHVPHYLRPQHIVERRNRRERLRVRDVNQAFFTLQQLLPLDTSSSTTSDQKDQSDTARNPSRTSKAQTLRKAMDYIEALRSMLNETN